MDEWPPPILAPHWPPAGWLRDGVEPRPVGRTPSPSGLPAAFALPPEYLATKSATASASGPTTMFWGMIAPENPPLRMAYRTRSLSSQRTEKFGPSLRSRVRTLAAEPCVPAALNVWQPEHRCLKRDRKSVV